MKQRFRQTCAVVLSALFLGLVLISHAQAVEMLQNNSFESYDAGTLVPDNWIVIEGSVQAYTGDVYEGSASAYSLGGTAVDDGSGGWTVTPNTTQGGTLVQLVDISSHPDFGAVNWMNVSGAMNVHLWSGTRIDMYVEYLPESYNATTVTADDPAWNGLDVQIALNRYYSSTRPTWYERHLSAMIPAVRWVRYRLVYNAAWKSDSDFTGGDYYVTVDAVSLDVTMEGAGSCADNLLLNPGFESVTGDAPDDWHLRSGSMAAMDQSTVIPYAGTYGAGNLGGTVVAGVDYPETTQNGSLVQLVDLSTLADWSEASYIYFNFRLFFMRNNIQDMSYTVEYLPESYNAVSVTWDDAAWDSEAVIAVTDGLGLTGYEWDSIAVGPGALPVIRWLRVRLDVDDGSVRSTSTEGAYLGAFDQVCLQAGAVITGSLIENGDFENVDENYMPLNWHPDPVDGELTSYVEPLHPAYYQAKADSGTGDTTGRIYQVIDMANQIPGWAGINPNGGDPIEYRFIQLALSAAVANIGGTSARIGLEYLPYSYNTIDGITWDHAAWQPRQWTSDGTAFTNLGEDAIDLGAVIEDTTVTDPYVETWRNVSYNGWLPRVRWLRLRIELDATAVAGGTLPIVAFDNLALTAQCLQWGPYSGFGNLPEATFYEDPNAPDKAIPAWVGPEGDGISGGYTGQTVRNYVNPLFAGFADDAINYLPSGEDIPNEMFTDPMAITGTPWNDASWNYVIICMGDMSLASLADYFGPAPSGIYHPGEITAVFNESPIMNGNGPDFATFENGFSAGWTTPEIFAELAYVEVSSNGTDFIRMPTHSLTPMWPGNYGTLYATGVFGLTGKHINAYGDQWGTPFDLDWIADHPQVLDGTVDLNDIRYVRQVDMVGGGPEDASGMGTTGTTSFSLDSFGNPIFDSWPTYGSGGADLDAVAVINSSAADSDGDHITDYWDNCSQTSNDNQYDTDADGYGNMCDCDLDNDGQVNMNDYNVFRDAWLGYGPERIPGEPGQPDTYTNPSANWNADADFNGDNTVNLEDFNIMRSRWLQTAPFN